MKSTLYELCQNSWWNRTPLNSTNAQTWITQLDASKSHWTNLQPFFKSYYNVIYQMSKKTFILGMKLEKAQSSMQRLLYIVIIIFTQVLLNSVLSVA